MDEYLDNELIERFENMLENNESLFFDSDEYVEIITYYLDILDLDYAQKALDLAEELYSGNVDIRIKRLEYFISNNQLQEAENILEELKFVAEDDFDFIVSKARLFSLKGNHQKAIELYLLAEEHKQELDFIYNSIGNEYLDIDDYAMALLYFKKSLQLEPDDEYSLYSCIHCYESLDKIEPCISFINEYINQNPYSESAWFQLGIQYQKKEDYKHALWAFDYVITINPTSLMGYHQKAASYEALSMYEKAIHCYVDSLEYDQSGATTYAKVGICFKKLGNHIQALKYFLQSIYEDPQLDMPWSEISDLYDAMGNKEEALYYLERALDLDPENIIYLKKHAYLNINLKKFEESIQDFQKILDIETDNFNNHFAYSELLITVGEYKMAIAHLQKSVVQFKRAELYYQLSNCYFLLKDLANGVENLKEALKLNPNIKREMYTKYPILKWESDRLEP